MPKFSISSGNKLFQCDQQLRDLFNEVVKHFDCTIICGHRARKEQDGAFETGRSKLKFPQSKHNTIPSDAVDVIAYPIDWYDRERHTYFAGFVKGMAASMGIDIRWGGDWDGDTKVKDNSFDDLVHFELIKYSAGKQQ